VLSPLEAPFVSITVYGIRLNEIPEIETRAIESATTFFGFNQDFRIISQRPVSLGPNTLGHEIVVGFTSNGVDLRAKQVSVIRSTQYFLIDVVANADNFLDQSDEIDALLSSFTLLDPEPYGASRQDSLFLAAGTILTLDPALYRGSAGGIPGSLFSGLVTLDKDLHVVPDLAERWEVSEDGIIYTFYLREGLQFHNGKRVTAHDVKFSWERAADPATDSPKAKTFLGDIVGVNAKLKGEAQEIAGVEVIDDLTLRVTIDRAKGYFLQKLAYPTSYVVDRTNVLSGNTWTDRANGTGPFKLKQWNKNELVVLERNERYYRGVPELAHAVYRLFGGSSMVMYEQGEIDVATVAAADVAKVLDPTSPLNQDLVVTPLLCTTYLALNPNIPPFDDPKVRQAFALALNVDQWIEAALNGTEIRASSILPPLLPGHNDALTPVPFFPEFARQLIADSKYGSVEGLPPASAYAVSGEFLTMWRDNLGVEVESKSFSGSQEMYDLRDSRQIPLTDTGWCADYPDPQNFLEVLFQTDSVENFVGYSNPEVDALLSLAAVEQDPITRLAMYQDIERAILSDWVVVPLSHKTSYTLIKPHVKGHAVPAMGVHVLKDVFILFE
jgi:oligopeptide transport system substrate-binding protein